MVSGDRNGTDAAEQRFPPPAAFTAQANGTAGLYAQADRDYERYWAAWARKLEWSKPFTEVLTWNEPFARWFGDGELNASVNCLDRHVRAGRGATVAYYFEGEPGDRRAVTYDALLRDVCRFANGLRSLGITKGDRVGIYMPMVAELPVAMLACARIGAVHTVMFGGFSAEPIVDRLNDAGCVALITTDQGWRRGKRIPLKANADIALRSAPGVKHCIVSKRGGEPVDMVAGRDVWWDDAIAGQPQTCTPEPMNAEDLLYLLYTSGTTAKPKGIKHTTGGYLTGVAATQSLVFDIKETDVYWSTGDLAWVTGHSYGVYGPLLTGATSVLYEGTPDFPDKDRFWEIVERYRVTILYTAPTAIRTFMKWGTEYVRKHDLSSLRLLGSVGESINPAAWLWYREHIGANRCPIVDTWWQTETGAIMIAPLPGVTTTLPGSATTAIPGIYADVVDERGDRVPPGGDGYLVVRKPWPAMTRGIWRDDERFRETYWSKFPGMYLAGDGCARDEAGNFWLGGRVDDVMNVSGHRISTVEVENAFVEHPRVAEAAVVGKTDDITGQAICAFVTLRDGDSASPALAEELRAFVGGKLGKFTTPKDVTFTADLPKNRGGKIMRRLLRDIAEGRPLGDTTTLADASVVAELQRLAQSEPGRGG
ncbi:MAG: acetate--CoA ligase [Candidatus Elarobacter sp.]